MNLTRALNKLICRVLIGMVLFAQFAVASYACPTGGSADMPAGQHMVQSLDGAGTGGDSDLDHHSPNLCSEHCKVGQQSSDVSPAPVITAPALDLLYVLPFSDDAAVHGLTVAAFDPLLAVPPPPHAILHCVFRT
jgi:hypothetical protein